MKLVLSVILLWIGPSWDTRENDAESCLEIMIFWVKVTLVRRFFLMDVLVESYVPLLSGFSIVSDIFCLD